MNILKPKKTTFNPRALVYRRVTRIEQSRASSLLYSCENQNGTYSYYMFNATTAIFDLIDINTLTFVPTIISVPDNSILFTNGTYYYYWNKNYSLSQGAWVRTDTMPSEYSTLLDAGFTNIGKYQTNRYVYVGAIDYIISGEVAGTITQPLKGQLMHLTSLNIKYYDDFLQLEEEDMVVVDGRLYSVESPDYSIKHSPRPYKIYYATLNSVL